MLHMKASDNLITGKKKRALVRIWVRRFFKLIIFLTYLVLWLLIATNYGIGQDINRILNVGSSSPSSKHVATANIKKSESVYVDTLATGVPKSVVVDVKLKNNPENTTLIDTTSLSDIYNINGNEDFDLSKNGTLAWNTPEGQDIFYEGLSSTDNLPVNMAVEYYLDGKQVDGSKLTGKSGKLKIVIHYKSNVVKNINGIDTPVPFACLTAMLVSNDNFKNIKVSSGKVVQQGPTKYVMVYAFPGLAQALNSDLVNDGFAETVTIEGTANNFESNEIVSVLTGDILKVVSNKSLGKINMDDKIYQLDVSTQALVDGSKQLADGCTLLNDNLPQLTDGISQATDGSALLSEELAKALNQMKTSTALLNQATDASVKIIAKEDEALRSLQNDEKTGTLDLASNSKDEILAYLTALSLSNSEVRQVLKDNNLDPLDFTYGIGENAKQINVINSAISLDDSLKKASLTVRSVRYIHDGAMTQEEIEAVEAFKNATGNTDIDYLKLEDGTYMGYTELLNKINDGTTQLYGGLEKATAEKNSLTSGAEDLSKGMRQIKAGTKTLTGGTKKLATGSAKLSNGMSKYYKKGISKIIDLYNDNVKGLSEELKRIKAAGAQYDNYSGKSSNMDSSVSFMYFTHVGDY